MPIKPENKSKYPPDWMTRIRPAILERAGHCCEGSETYPDCRAMNGQHHPVTGSKVVLTVGHVNHDPEDNRFLAARPDDGTPVWDHRDNNLVAWCQRCHLTHDAPHHAMNAGMTRMQKDMNHRNQIPLFPELV